MKIKSLYQLSLSLALVFGLLGCSNETESLFDQSPSQRMEAAIESTQTTLCDAPNGWLLEFFPSIDGRFGGYNILMKFSQDGTVEMASDIVKNPEQVLKSHYTVRQLGGLTLSFDTYNKMLHIFGDPVDPNDVSEIGEGYQGDYDFSVISIDNDVITLKGRKTQTTMKMRRMDVKTSWQDYLAAVLKMEKAFAGYFIDYTVPGDIESHQGYRPRNFRNIVFSHTVNGEKQSDGYPYIVTDKGVKFQKLIPYKSKGDYEYVYNPLRGTFDGASGGVLKRYSLSPIEAYFSLGIMYLRFEDLSPALQDSVRKADAKLFKDDKATWMDATTEQMVSLYGNQMYAFRVGFDSDLQRDLIYPMVYPSTDYFIAETYMASPVQDETNRFVVDEIAFGMPDVTFNTSFFGLGRAFYDTGMTSWITNRVFTLELDDANEPTKMKLTDKANPDIWFWGHWTAYTFGRVTDKAAK